MDSANVLCLCFLAFKKTNVFLCLTFLAFNSNKCVFVLNSNTNMFLCLISLAFKSRKCVFVLNSNTNVFLCEGDPITNRLQLEPAYLRALHENIDYWERSKNVL